MKNVLEMTPKPEYAEFITWVRKPAPLPPIPCLDY